MTRTTCLSGFLAPASPLLATTGHMLSRLRSCGMITATSSVFLRRPNFSPRSIREVVLLVNEGVQFFDLRAIYIRGRVKSVEAPNDAPAGRTWFEVIPIKTVAWDYGTLREVTDES